jgi:modulator of FtsH protease HflC
VKTPILVGGALLAALLLFSSVYTLSETEQVILTQFGRPVGGVVSTPGLHAKVPFIQNVHRFDKRWLEFDGDSNEIPTRDKKYIWVDTYARWRIADALRFFQAVRDERGGQSRLDDIVDGETRNAVASFDLIEIVRSGNRAFQTTEELAGIGAAEAMAHHQHRPREDRPADPGAGLEDHPRVRGRARGRALQADQLHGVGAAGGLPADDRGEAADRRAEPLGGPGPRRRDPRARRSATCWPRARWATRSAQELKGKADAKATTIYARAYGRDPGSTSSGSRWRRSRSALDKDATVILSTDSELLKYMKDSSPRGGAIRRPARSRKYTFVSPSLRSRGPR